MNQVSLAQSRIILNTVRFQGWSNDTDALSCPTIDLAKANQGADGKSIITDTGLSGGEVVMKFMANSPTVKFLQNIIAQKQAAGVIVDFSGTIQWNFGVITTLSGGGLIKGPLAPSVGAGETKAHEYTFYFEKIISEYLTANF